MCPLVYDTGTSFDHWLAKNVTVILSSQNVTNKQPPLVINSTILFDPKLWLAAQPPGPDTDRQVLVGASIVSKESMVWRWTAAVAALAAVTCALRAQQPPQALQGRTGQPLAGVAAAGHQERRAGGARGRPPTSRWRAVQVAVADVHEEWFSRRRRWLSIRAASPVAMLKADGAPRIDLASATRKDFVVIYTKRPSADAAARVKTDPAFAQELACHR